MDEKDQEFIRKYREQYGVEMLPGPGAPCLNGVPLKGEELREILQSDDDGKMFPNVKPLPKGERLCCILELAFGMCKDAELFYDEDGTFLEGYL